MLHDTVLGRDKAWQHSMHWPGMLTFECHILDFQSNAVSPHRLLSNIVSQAVFAAGVDTGSISMLQEEGSFTCSLCSLLLMGHCNLTSCRCSMSCPVQL